MYPILDAVQQPEYVGENRCIPCTATNLVIAAGLSALLGWLASVPVAVAAFAFCAATIYLRGYLVPGTPALTKRYFPAWLLDRFGKSSRPVDVGDVDADAMLREAGVLTAAAAEEEPEPTAEFRDALAERVDALAGEGAPRDRLLERLGTPDGEATFEDRLGGFRLHVDDETVGVWESGVAVRTDLAAADLLADREPLWASLGVENRVALLRAVRERLAACPDCGGPVAIDLVDGDHCCKKEFLPVLTCEACGSRLFEYDEQPAS